MQPQQQPQAHALNILSDGEVSLKFAELVTSQNTAHPGACRTLAQNASMGHFHNGPRGSCTGVVTLVSMLKTWEMQILCLAFTTISHYLMKREIIRGLVKRTLKLVF